MGVIRKVICSVLIILFTALTPVTIHAEDTPSSSAFSSPLDDIFNSKNANDHIRYRDNYSLDTIDGSMFSLSDTFQNGLNSFANVLFQVQVVFAYMLITVFYYSFELDIYGMLSEVVNTFMHEMKTSIFDELSLIAILILGLFFIVKVIQNQKTQVWVAIIQTALIVAIALYFFNNPMQILKQVDNGSKAISKSVLAGTFKANNSGASPESAVMAAVDNIWSAYVHQPWQMLEFGNMEMAKREENKILSLPPGSKERKEYIKKLAEDEKHFTPDWGVKRLGLQIAYAIPLILIFAVIAIMCFFMISYQVLTILFTLLGAFVLVMALIPFFGMKILQNWAAKIIGFASIKVIICFCIGVMLAFMTAIFKLSDQYGWILTLLLVVIIVLSIIWKREALLELFTLIRLTPHNPSMINKQLRKDSNVESRINNFMGSGMSGFRKGKTGNPDEKKSKSDAKKPADTSEKIKAEESSEAGDGPKKRKAKKSVSSGDKSGSGQSYTGSSGNSPNTEASYSGILNEMNDDQTEDNNNFRQLMKKAEEILQKQYEISKMEAENKADKLQKEPEYSSFVRKADTREALGAPKFEQREIIAVANNLQKIVDAGGSPEELLSRNETSKSSEDESRPKDVIGLVVNGQQQSIDRGEAYKIIVQDAAKDYTNEFNQKYNKKYDDKFFEDLIKRYGKQNVRQILSRMKEVKEKEGNIKNPAGYLTQSLKNSSMENGGSMRSKGADKID
ncbi:CD3337/EF1877 family mobilome membrane protein [Ruminiclostridium papyrosolvens]|uniref:CD3337/EF1877 family mobilome membrane protein n=1 Tax=Ruminiclostridium papyrosolvens TaxID=29362 RepID=UPI0004CF095F|nr:MFS transporter [Ruminiclostridium papyrosolvens]